MRERDAGTLVGLGIGLLIGAATGGLGLAIGGTAIGLSGALTGGALGAGVGRIVGAEAEEDKE